MLICLNCFGEVQVWVVGKIGATDNREEAPGWGGRQGIMKVISLVIFGKNDY